MEVIKKLKISMTSDTRKMSNCPRTSEGVCGIMYRMS